MYSFDLEGLLRETDCTVCDYYSLMTYNNIFEDKFCIIPFCNNNLKNTFKLL